MARPYVITIASEKGGVGYPHRFSYESHFHTFSALETAKHYTVKHSVQRSNT